MAMGKRQAARREDLWLAAAELHQRPGHPRRPANRTARRELGELMAVGAVGFVGCAGTGRYRLTAHARPSP